MRSKDWLFPRNSTGYGASSQPVKRFHHRPLRTSFQPLSWSPFSLLHRRKGDNRPFTRAMHENHESKVRWPPKPRVKKGKTNGVEWGNANVSGTLNPRLKWPFPRRSNPFGANPFQYCEGYCQHVPHNPIHLIYSAIAIYHVTTKRISICVILQQVWLLEIPNNANERTLHSLIFPNSWSRALYMFIVISWRTPTSFERIETAFSPSWLFRCELA
jgi:hypothetical protein